MKIKVNMIEYNNKDKSGIEFLWSEKQIITQNFVSPFKPIQHALHTLSVFIDNKNNGIVGKLGSRAVLLFIYPAKVIDLAIQLLIAPIICLIGVCIEAFQPHQVGGWTTAERIKAIALIPLQLFLYIPAHLVFHTVTLVACGLLNVVNPVLCLIHGTQASVHYFAGEQRGQVMMKAIESEKQSNGDQIITPYLSLSIPEELRQPTTDILAERVKWLKGEENSFHSSLFFFA